MRHNIAYTACGISDDVWPSYPGPDPIRDMVLRQFFGDHNVRSRTGKCIGNTVISAMLVNPMYYGHFRYRGEVYEGIHEAIITKKLFDDVQTVIN